MTGSHEVRGSTPLSSTKKFRDPRFTLPPLLGPGVFSIWKAIIIPRPALSPKDGAAMPAKGFLTMLSKSGRFLP